MNKHFKANERELIKVATFFKKQSKKLIFEGKIGEEHKTVEEAVDRFIEHMIPMQIHGLLFLSKETIWINLWGIMRNALNATPATC